eukprot:6187551-Pleurochrysis_carterae.AAC.5
MELEMTPPPSLTASKSARRQSLRAQAQRQARQLQYKYTTAPPPPCESCAPPWQRAGTTARAAHLTLCLTARNGEEEAERREIQQ